MKNILVTGGTGDLGKEVVQQLLNLNHKVYVLTSRQDPLLPAACEVVKANLVTGEGLKKAAKEADIIIHCASNAKDPKNVDEEGTKNLLRVIGKNRVQHFIYISIVGIDKSIFPYYLVKARVEKMIQSSGVPFTVLRATQFHSFVLKMIGLFSLENGSMIVPKGIRFQPVDVKEVAARLVRISQQHPAGMLPDMGGPEVLTIEQMVQDYLKSCRRTETMQLSDASNERYELFRSGINLCPSNAYGKITWRTFLQHHFKNSNSL